MKTRANQCEGRARGEGRFGGMNAHQCTRKGMAERDGHFFCKSHDPVSRKEREEAKEQEWKRHWDAVLLADRTKQAVFNVCAGVSLEKLEELGVGWLAAHL